MPSFEDDGDLSRRVLMANSSAKPKKKWVLDPGWATVIAALILTAGGTSGVILGRASVHSSINKSAYFSSARTPKLDFQLPQDNLIPYCSRLDGTGQIPNGDAVVIFDRQVNDNDEAASTSLYSFDGSVVASGGGWSLPQIYIGSLNESSFTDELAAVLVSSATASFFDGIATANGWGTRTLPVGLETIHAFVTRTGHDRQCI
jgi:hypothetical protein